MTPLRLLQVEDTEDDAALVERALTRAGYDVFARRVDTAEALRRELHEAEWDLVIADYTMPGFSGTKALAIVREQHPDLPFIFVSGTIGEDTAVAAMRTGAHDYIMKDNLTRLAPAVERELREATVRRERHLASQRVAYLAYHDSLTDLPNRALFLDRLQQAILRSHRDDKGLAVLLIDLDGFKEINDALGHHAGDQVLQEVATRLRGALRASDTVARLGGDEFAVLLPATDVNRAELAARKMLHDLQHPFVADGRPLMVSASIGIAGVPWHAATSDEVLQKADSAMYLAKNDKTGYVVYNPSRDQRVNSRVSLASSMRQAIDDRQFVLDYQPIVHIHTGTRAGDRVAGALEPSRAGPPAAGRIHPRRRAHRPRQSADLVRHRARADRLAAVGAAGRLRHLASTSRRAACITARSPAASATCSRRTALAAVVADAGDHREPGDVGSRSVGCAASTSCTRWACGW